MKIIYSKILLILIFLFLLFIIGWLWWDNYLLKGQVYTMSVYAGTIQAAVDYENNKFRLYELEPEGSHRFSGSKEGPFEKWYWPSFKSDCSTSKMYVESYNKKMKKLYKEKIRG